MSSYQPLTRRSGPISQTAPFVLLRVTTSGVTELVASATTFEQACDLARSDRARLRDLSRIESLDRHDVVTRATNKVRSISVPR